MFREWSYCERGLFGFEGQERCEETRCDTLLCDPASDTTESCGAAVASVPLAPPLPPFSPRPPFSDVKIYKGAHRVHFVTGVHKQSVSFPYQKHGVPSEREKTFLADIMYTNVHRRPPVPAKNRCYVVGFFSSSR